MPTVFVSHSHMDCKWCDAKARHRLIPWLDTALGRDRVTRRKSHRE